MSYFQLERDETLGEGVHRIFQALADDALAMLRDPAGTGVEAAIHEVRKRCKEGRGLARLVRPALGDEYIEANRLLRDAARALAPIRDAQSRLDIFDALVASQAPLVPDEGFLTIRTALAQRTNEAHAAIMGPEQHRLDQARDLITEAREAASRWEIPDDFEPVRRGVAKTYKRGRNRRSEASLERTPEVFHEWRKRVKYLWYQVQLVKASAPSMLAPLAERLHDLSDALGNAHDLAILERLAHEWGDEVPDDERERFAMLAGGRRADLEDRALALGARIYAESHEAFAARLEAYWDTWADGAERPAGELEGLFSPGDSLDDRSYQELYETARAVDLPGRSAMTRAELVKSLRAAGVG